MKERFVLCAFVLALLGSSSALEARNPPASLLPSFPEVAQARKVKCDVTHKSGVNPRTEDCANAMYRLSDSDSWAVLTNKRDLPVTETLGTCVVTVAFERADQEWASWLYLQMAANRLLAACSYSGTFRSHVGGTVWDGRAGRIGISFTRNNKLSVSQLNSTESTNTTVASNEIVQPWSDTVGRPGNGQGNLSAVENTIETYRP